jgi:carboxyl-terminal processing protease
MNPRRSSLGPGLVFLLALAVGGWFLRLGVAQDRGGSADARLLQEVLDHIADRYVESVDRNALYESAIEGILRELGDPNTALMNPETFENFRLQTEGDYGGVGLEISDRDDFITVVSPLPGTPGSRAGIRAGDEIVEVEGASTRDWPVQQAVQHLRGQPGTSVQVRIQRPGVEAPIDFSLTRERIQLHSVPFATLLDEGIGYIPLGLFSENSTREVRAAADSLRSAGATSFILDLRGNPGGILDQGVGIADLFLPRGAAVVETRGG